MKNNILVLIIGGLLSILLSCNQVFEKPLENDSVELTAPVNNLVTTIQNNTFAWEELNGALNYRLQIVSPRFDSIARFVIDSTVNRTNLNLTLDTGKYEWRVKGLNNSSSSLYSVPRTFTIQ